MDEKTAPMATRIGVDADVPAVVAALAEAFASDPVLAFLLDDGPDPDQIGRASCRERV